MQPHFVYGEIFRAEILLSEYSDEIFLKKLDKNVEVILIVEINNDIVVGFEERGFILSKILHWSQTAANLSFLKKCHFSFVKLK